MIIYRQLINYAGQFRSAASWNFKSAILLLFVKKAATLTFILSTFFNNTW